MRAIASHGESDCCLAADLRAQARRLEAVADRPEDNRDISGGEAVQ